jgi:hypothetical protein
MSASERRQGEDADSDDVVNDPETDASFPYRQAILAVHDASIQFKQFVWMDLSLFLPAF